MDAGRCVCCVPRGAGMGIEEYRRLGQGRAVVFYQEVVRPLATAQRELMETLRETREKDSEALTSLAADVHALNQTIKCRHDA